MSTIPSYLLDSVKASEGYFPRSYWDYKQHTNGWGTRARFAGEIIDEAEAQRRLDDELGKSWVYVNERFPNAPEGVRAALADLHYNAGATFAGAGLGAAVDRGDYADARRRFLQYNQAGGEVLPGLVARRERGAKWFDGTPEVPFTEVAAATQAPQQGLPGTPSGPTPVKPPQAVAGAAPAPKAPFTAPGAKPTPAAQPGAAQGNLGNIFASLIGGAVKGAGEPQQRDPTDYGLIQRVMDEEKKRRSTPFDFSQMYG